MKNIAIGVAFVLAILARAVIPATLATKQSAAVFAYELDSTQVAMWLNHLQEFEGITSDLEKGCNDVALEKAKNGIDQEMGLLSTTLKESKNQRLVKQANDAYPGIQG